MERKKLVEILLEKRFGEKKPENIACLLEVNTFSSIEEENFSGIGIGVQLVIKTDNNQTLKEDYQINHEGIIFSWGNTPVIDERSLKKKL
ncbi:MAG TPA: hypothetical protein P5556_02520 [Candidatus Gastranaerophilales bacterium]|nr:hypothetical protein [Candidatus Gastranaerophilales bacterium]